MGGARLFDQGVSAALLVASTLVAVGTRGVPSASAFARSHVTMLPPVLSKMLPARATSDLRVEHIVRHVSYALSMTLSIVGVDFASWTEELTLFYVAAQCGLYLFSVTHALEYWGVLGARTHFGDTPVLAFLLVSVGMFIACDATQYVFLRSVLFAIPLRVALSTLMLLAHADFASHATTRTEDPAFDKCSHVGVALATLFACLVEAGCGFGAFAFFPIVASLWVMHLEPTLPLTMPTGTDLVSMAMAAIFASAAALGLYHNSAPAAVLGATAVLFFGVVGRYLLGERSYLPTPLLAAYCTWHVLRAWDPVDDAAVEAARAVAWVVVFGGTFGSMYVLTRW